LFFITPFPNVSAIKIVSVIISAFSAFIQKRNAKLYKKNEHHLIMPGFCQTVFLRFGIIRGMFRFSIFMDRDSD